VKGAAAEGSKKCHSFDAWVVGEYPPDCHIFFVKRYCGRNGMIAVFNIVISSVFSMDRFAGGLFLLQKTGARH